MNNPSDISPIGAGNAIVQINRRGSKQQRQQSGGEQKPEPAPNSPTGTDQNDPQTPSSDENHQGVDRYV